MSEEQPVYTATPSIPVAICPSPTIRGETATDEELDLALLQAVEGMTSALSALRSVLRKRKERRLLP